MINQPAFMLVANRFEVRSMDPVTAKGKREPINVYEVLDLR
jgi:hypothetical protein